jgi:predicted ribosome quality control (RQC) complex YloA/Tae2 family protein
MDIQKPTVLDAARISGELKRLLGAIIFEIYCDVASSVVILITNSPIFKIRYQVEKKYAFMAETSNIPSELRPMLPQLAGSKIIDVKQLGSDRIISFEIEKEDRLGRKRQSKLIFELMPNQGNMFWLDENDSIKWALKRKNENHYRAPGKLKKPTVLNFTEHRDKIQIDKPEQIQEAIYGLNERDIINLGFLSTIDEAFNAIGEYVNRAQKPGPGWVIYENDKAIGYSLVAPTLGSGESQLKFDSALTMYDNYYQNAAVQVSLEDRLESLQKILEREIARQEDKIGALENERLKAEASRIYKQYGELLLANIDTIKKGTKQVRLQNFGGQTPEYIEIELDPAKSVTANAENFFKRFKKVSSTLNAVAGRIDGVREKLKALQAIKSQCYENPEKLAIELEKKGLIPKRAAPKLKKTVARRLPYKKYISSSGWEILVGRTNTDNDELTFKIAAKDDYWFHAWQAAGSHTVLRLPNRQAVPDKKTILEAAALAAYFSKARTSSKVPVAYTQVKFVRKPRNFPPGKVLVEKEKQLIVHPLEPDQFLARGDSEE